MNATATTLGEITLVLMRNSRWRDRTLTDLREFVFPFLEKGGVVLARNKEGEHPDLPVGVAFVASVDEETDTALKSGADPVGMTGEQLFSGSIPWVVELAATKDAAKPFLAQVAQSKFDGQTGYARLYDKEGVARPVAIRPNEGGEPPAVDDA